MIEVMDNFYLKWGEVIELLNYYVFSGMVSEVISVKIQGRKWRVAREGNFPPRF
jgi:hypothetical protein